MSYYKHHVFFCLNKREAPENCCACHGSEAMQEYAKKRIKELKLNGEGRVRVIDLEGGDPVAEFEAGAQPARIELSGDGRRAFVIDPQASRLLVFDTATHQPLYSHVVDGVPLGMLPDATGGKIVLTLAAAGAVVEVDVASGRVLRRVDVGQVADGLAES